MAAIVSSTSAFANVMSEQWKPSPSAIGCNAVLVKFVPSAETVASRHGSSSHNEVCQSSVMNVRLVGLTFPISEEQAVGLDEPSIVGLVCLIDSGSRGLAERLRERQNALSLPR